MLEVKGKSIMLPTDIPKTHEVFNQSPIFGGHNAYIDDPMLQVLCHDLSPSVQKELEGHGKWAGSADTLELARQANRNVPVLKSFDSKGNRIDCVEFHPAWHALMERSISLGMHASCWQDLPEESGQRHQARAARYYITSGVEMGHLCPVTMTNACVAALLKSPEIARLWLPQITSRDYDSSNKPAGSKRQVLLGMGMTEKQGGTDVRANTTRATPLGGDWWQIIGHKWFMSVPQSDAFLILAQTKEGLGCFLVPRLRDDGTDNGLRFQRLKDKLGNRSNASSEVELLGSQALLIGPPGKGVQTIIEMVTLTRLDCAVASAGLMRAALWEAVEHCRYRSVMGEALWKQPLMRCVLADMTVDLLAATSLAFRLARSFDRSAEDSSQSHYCRLMTPVIKYWTCKLAPPMIYEAMECLGGNGYVEDGNLSRHYREAPLNAIWEGSGNVMCLDVLRVLGKQPDALEAVLSSMVDVARDSSPGAAKAMEHAIDQVRSVASKALEDPSVSRWLVERLASLAASAELSRLGIQPVAEAFIETRLGGSWRTTYGMLDKKYVDSVLDAGFQP